MNEEIRKKQLQAAWEIWQTTSLSRAPDTAPLLIELERRALQLQIDSNIFSYSATPNALYATTFYRLVTFFANSSNFIELALHKPALALEVVQTCEINNLFQHDPDTFEQDMILIQLRKEEHVQLEPSTMFTCRRCNSNKSFYRQDQKSSGDEGRTVIGYCADCGTGFRFRL